MKKIGEILLELDYVTASDIERALKVQKAEGGKRRLGEILSEFAIKEEQVLTALSKQYNIPILREEEFPKTMPLEKVSFGFLKENIILPISITDNILKIAISDPTKTELIDNMRASFGYEVRLYLASVSDIANHIEVLWAASDAQVQRALEGVTEEEPDGESEEISHLRDIAQDKGIIQLVNLFIDNAVKDKASDIHIEPEETEVRVRYRIDGILYDKEMLPLKTQAALASRIKLLSQMNIAERRLPQDGRIKGRFEGRDIDIRVSTIPTIYGESIVMRLLDRRASYISLEELGFDSILFEKYDSLIKKPYGMILITGPTGSGKTTTLYASLDKINSPGKKIITIEEPVEYLLKGINQIQVRPKIGLTFANGLRNIVRQDPDIIMVGEIRDIETANISIHAALTGHLLFSTLHTNDAPSAITRLIDMGIENYLVSSTLIGVMAQRLVRRICPQCKESYSPSEDIKERLGISLNTLWRGKGCEHCLSTGYRGRIAIFELLLINDAIRELIMTKATSREIKEKAIEGGMRILREDGIEKVKKGITTVDEVLRVTQVEL